MKKHRTRIALLFRQNRRAIAFVVAWLAANAAVFVRVFGMPKTTALLVATCITKTPGGWPGAYQSFTEVVVFGLVASMIVANVTRRYRPEETSRALAASSSSHVVVIGYTNFGRRVRDLVVGEGRAAVVVEGDAARVAELVRDEEPVVVGSAQDPAVLADASVARAKVVVVATDDLETAAVACRLVREVNEACELVVRCPDDDAGAVLARAYRARAVSTSKLAAELLAAQARKAHVKSAVVLGDDGLGARVAEAFTRARIATTKIPVTEDPAALTAAGVAAADLVVVCDDDLGKNLIRVDRIRDVAPKVRIACRSFHDAASLVLARPPLSCGVFSTSKHAVEMLARAGVFRDVGIDAAPAVAAQPLAG